MAFIAENTFAAACYDQNSIKELEAALAGAPDATDMATWNLTADEWTAEVRLALSEKVWDASVTDAPASDHAEG